MNGETRYLFQVVHARVAAAEWKAREAESPSVVRELHIKVGKTYLAEAKAYLAKLKRTGPRRGSRAARFHREVLLPLASEIQRVQRIVSALPGAREVHPYPIDIAAYEQDLERRAREFLRNEIKQRLLGR